MNNQSSKCRCDDCGKMLRASEEVGIEGHFCTRLENWEEKFLKDFKYIAQALDFYASEHYLEIKKKGTEHLDDIKSSISNLLREASENRAKDISKKYVEFVKDKWQAPNPAEFQKIINDTK